MTTVRSHRHPSHPRNVSDAPAAASEPAAQVSFDGSVKVMTINIHKLVPGSLVRKEGKHSTESVRALRDVRDFIKKQNPDVVVFQELDNDVRGKSAKHGVPAQLAKLARGVGATGSAMASATGKKGGNGYDNAIITRNGFTLDEVVDAKLPRVTRASNDRARSVGVADVVTPGGQQHVSVFFTHATPHADGARDRAKQLKAIAAMTRGVSDGSLTVRDAQTGKRVKLSTDRGAPVIVAGDLNATQRVADRFLEGSGRKGDPGLTNVLDMRARHAGHNRRGATNGHHRIDHVYASDGFDLIRSSVLAVPERRVHDPVGVTDHKAVVAELSLRPAKRRDT